MCLPTLEKWNTVFLSAEFAKPVHKYTHIHYNPDYKNSMQDFKKSLWPGERTGKLLTILYFFLLKLLILYFAYLQEHTVIYQVLH